MNARKPDQADDYHITIHVPTPPSETAAAIARVAAWWTKGFTGRAEMAGDTFTVRFGETFVDFEVAEMAPAHKIVWRVSKSNLPFISNTAEWTGTKVVWEVAAEKSGTKLGMTHVGLKPGIECYEVCREGWSFYVGQSLLQLLNTGQGLPDRRPGARR
jgi:Activator of Hsp90 ATPase homolog 1-like protein